MVAARSRIVAGSCSIERRPADAAPEPVPPEGLRVATLCLDDGEAWALFDWPVVPPSLPGLSAAEASVAALALEGRSNAEIARARGSAERTVANQLAAAYRKLGIGSRLELYALAARRSPR
jgi:DNA-binding CsgD family transcriptional regulator